MQVPAALFVDVFAQLRDRINLALAGVRAQWRKDGIELLTKKACAGSPENLHCCSD